MKKLKNITAICCLLSIAFVSCKKDQPLTGTETNTAFVSFTNVNSSAKTVDFFVYGTRINTAAAGATILGTYAGVAPGSNTFVAKDATGATPIYYSTPSTVAAQKSYSFFLYDTLIAGQLKGVLLNTDRTADANSANSKFRFLNFNPKAPAFDVIMVRQVSNNATTPALIPKDSVLISGGAGYIGSSVPNIAALSAFTSLPANQLANSGAGNLQTNYVVKLKLAGTQTLVGSATLTLIPGKNYTLILRGVYPTLTLTLLLNN